ncbi:MAG TPA: hypothetical protein VMI32_05035 [Candidatus Solibacter sp.]|nr:hypothetical protein [Candidatus Solibacter sp.]
MSGRIRRTFWRSVVTGVCLIWAVTAKGQLPPLLPPLPPMVCPFTYDQTTDAIAAFAKMVPTFTQEPRCSNCHGGITDPTVRGTNHATGVESPGRCNTCHDAMVEKSPGNPSIWQLPHPEHNFVGKDAKTLCKQMKGSFRTAGEFVGHLDNDNGNSRFTETAFEGTHGLDDDTGQAFMGDGYRREPPTHITHAELVELGAEWVNAMGGQFQGDESCGCEPSHYALRIDYETQILLGIANAKNKMQTLDVPITFHDDGTFEGQAMAFFDGSGTALYCSEHSTSAMLVKISGDVKEQEGDHHFKVKIENGSPTVGQVAAVCPMISRQVNMNPGQHGEVNMRMDGNVNETQLQEIASTAAISTVIRAQIVKLP